jgi:hypothetical protein
MFDDVFLAYGSIEANFFTFYSILLYPHIRIIISKKHLMMLKIQKQTHFFNL